MTKKPSPIAEFRTKDVLHLREVLLGIINDKSCTRKDKIDASKLLLRSHHALAPDRSVTAKAVAQQAQKVDDKLSKAEAEEIQGLLDA